MRHRTRPLLLLLFLLLLLPADAAAEIAPRYYAQMQRDAPEYLQIEVLKVRHSLLWVGRTTSVTVTAKVIAVKRSKKGLVAGDVITIRYDHYRPPRDWVGPRPIPILRKGETCPAFLGWSDEVRAYRPAALGASFEPLIEQG